MTTVLAAFVVSLGLSVPAGAVAGPVSGSALISALAPAFAGEKGWKAEIATVSARASTSSCSYDSRQSLFEIDIKETLSSTAFGGRSDNGLVSSSKVAQLADTFPELQELKGYVKPGKVPGACAGGSHPPFAISQQLFGGDAAIQFNNGMPPGIFID
jgi:hypothetical protein